MTGLRVDTVDKGLTPAEGWHSRACCAAHLLQNLLTSTTNNLLSYCQCPLEARASRVQWLQMYQDHGIFPASRIRVCQASCSDIVDLLIDKPYRERDAKIVVRRGTWGGLARSAARTSGRW